MSSASAVNCLTAKANKCKLNAFNETVPICSQITDQQSCEYSYGCYFSGGQCKEIDASYCTMDGVNNSIVMCRKDQNDFCYFGSNGCSVCNERVGPNESMSLISMDGTRCMDKAIGCQPYYQRNDHAACRKYCEFTEQPDNTTYQCVDCKDLNKNVAIDGVCLTSEQCANTGATYRSQMLSNYTKMLNNTYDRRQSCTLSISKSSNYEITILNGKFSDLVTYVEAENNDRNSVCPQNYQKVDYWPLEQGESGPRITGELEGIYANVNQIISSRCICPAGYYIDVTDNDQCKQCQVGTTTYVQDQTECQPLCTNIVSISGECTDTCGFNEVIKKEGMIRRCQKCDPGHIVENGRCKPVPKSYFMRINPIFRAAPGPERCSDGKTTAADGAYSEAQCSVDCQGRKINYDGECVDTCPEGTRENGNYCTVCEAGTELKNGNCVQCPKGTYKGRFEPFCQVCPGTKTSQPGATDALECSEQCQKYVSSTGDCVDQCQTSEAAINGRCQACPAPQHVSADGTTCVTECPAGQELKGQQCQQCQPGYFKADAGDQACQQCSAGYVSKGGLSCEPCDPGQVPINNQCVECQADKVVSSDLTQCQSSCQAGEAPANRVCRQCGVGTFGDGSQCTPCGPGEYAAAGSSNCQPCMGASVPSADKSTCVQCTGSASHLSSDKTTCVSSCAPGEYPNNNLCEKCSKGTFSVDGSTCEFCTGNEYQDEAGQNSCKTCPGGVDGTNTTSVGNDGCANSCQPGKHKDDSGACVNCPAGTFSLSGVTCDKCTGLGWSLQGSPQCTNCGSDEIPSEDHTRCVACDKLIQELTNGTYACQETCSIGFGVIGSGKLCQKCPPGHQIDNSACVPCPVMTFYNETAQKCQKCPENGYSAEGASNCVLCQEDMPYVGVTGLSCVAACGPSLALSGKRCVKCPPGKVSSQKHNDVCHKCPAMSYAVDSTRCELCAPGTWSAAGQALCTSCGGAYVSASGDECVTHCPDGQITDESAKSCLRCPAGHYVAENICQPCGDGFQVASDGLGCVKCPTSTLSNEKTGFKCSLCEDGLVLSLDGKKCQKSCARNEQPVTVKINLATAEGVEGTKDSFVEGQQCEKCRPGYQSVSGLECIFVQDSYQQAIAEAQQRSGKKILIIVLPIIAILILVGVILAVVFTRKLKQKNQLKTAQFAYGRQKTVATGALQSRRQVESVI